MHLYFLRKILLTGSHLEVLWSSEHNAPIMKIPEGMEYLEIATSDPMSDSEDGFREQQYYREDAVPWTEEETNPFSPRAIKMVTIAANTIDVDDRQEVFIFS